MSELKLNLDLPALRPLLLIPPDTVSLPCPVVLSYGTSGPVPVLIVCYGSIASMRWIPTISDKLEKHTVQDKKLTISTALVKSTSQEGTKGKLLF